MEHFIFIRLRTAVADQKYRVLLRTLQKQGRWNIPRQTGIQKLLHIYRKAFFLTWCLDPQHKNVAARFQTKQMVKDNGIVCVKNNIILHNGIQKRLLHGKPVGIDFLLQLLVFGAHIAEGGIKLLHIVAMLVRGRKEL